MVRLRTAVQSVTKALGWLAFLFAMLLPGAVQAHSMPNSIVILTTGPASVRASLILPWAELRYDLSSDLLTPPEKLNVQGTRKLSDYLLRHIGGRTSDGEAWHVFIDRLSFDRSTENIDLLADVRFIPPAGVATTNFVLHDDAITNVVMSHVILIFVRQGAQGYPRLLGALQNPISTLAITSPQPHISFGLAAAFALGMQHLAEGPDHILFLLTLILPAPLLWHRGTWRGIKTTKRTLLDMLLLATAFSAGHSMTLALGVLGGWTFRQQAVEIGIAFSILSAAIAAWEPPPLGDKTAPVLAAGFGLIHGMAFSATLNELDLDKLGKSVAVAGFNLGVEAMQVIILLIVVPLVVMVAKTRFYRPIRLAGAGASGVAALIWMGARIAV